MGEERRSAILLVSIVSFLVLVPFLENHELGSLVLILNMYITLVAATMELSQRRVLLWSAVPVAASSMILLLISHYYPTSRMLLASSLMLALFFLLVSGSLFAYLGQRREITSGRLFVSVSLYFLLGLSWFALYDLLNTVQPGSFAEGNIALVGRVQPSKLLYFSYSTLTTLGYGDIVAVKPASRMLATLEAASGVLYIAITVARLVGSYQVQDSDGNLQRNSWAPHTAPDAENEVRR